MDNKNKTVRTVILTILVIVSFALFLITSKFNADNNAESSESTISSPLDGEYQAVSESVQPELNNADISENEKDISQISTASNYETDIISDSSTNADEDFSEPLFYEEYSDTDFWESGNITNEVPPGDENLSAEYIEYSFRNNKLLEQHYKKHGIEMGFDSAEEYERAACDAVNDPDALHKIEAEDGDDVYYVEATNEFVVVSTDGYIRTYFNPDKGIDYFNRQ